jgi:hypothetical protein
MIKLQIIDGSLQASNNESIILVAPKNLCAIDVLSLYDAIPIVVIYNKYLGNTTNIFTQPLANCEDSNGIPFNVNSFIKFSEENFGIDSATELFALGSILAANACVNNVVNVPNGNPSDVKTIGTGGDFAVFQTALASASVVDGTNLKLLNDITTATTINVNKAVVIDLQDFKVETPTNNPVLIFNITAGAVLKNGSLKHLKTTNTSIETVVNINSPSAPAYVHDVEFDYQEFAITTRGQYYIFNNNFKYVGASVTNSHRIIAIYGNANESRIFNNTFECSLKQGTTRYTNFIYATSTSGTSYSGKLFINDNIQTGGDLRQFFLQDSGVPTNMELYVANNIFNDFNGGIGIFGINIYNRYKKIGIYNNIQGADSAGNYKGLFYIDGAGAINENVIVEYGDNILGTTTLRPDYISYLEDGSSQVAIKNTITFVNKKAQVSLEDSLSGLGFIVQKLKSRKTYINGVSGSGTEENPYVIILPAEPELTAGSVLFSDGTTIAQDNDNFFWDNTNNRLGIGTKTPGARLDVIDDILINTITIGKGSGNVLSNTAVGFQALFIGNTGGGNTAFGNTSLRNNLTGYNCTAIGFGVLRSNQSGFGNTGIGLQSLYNNTTGNSNTGLGGQSLFQLVSGSNNVSVGASSGFASVGSNTTGSNSVFIGVAAKALGDNQANQIVIGWNAVGLGANSVVIGNDLINTTALKGNVLIGSTTSVASSKLTIESTTQGFLKPRMTEAQRLAIALPATGLEVYQTDGTEGTYIKKSTGWQFAY